MKPSLLETTRPGHIARNGTSHRAAFLWLVGATALGLVLLVLFPDSVQQDGGFHFLFARWAWVHPELFVGVWARPLFTTIYAIPAVSGYPAAKLLTVAFAVGTAWQTYRVAVHFRMDRAPLAIPLLFLQPSFFIICADTMTEPLFAFLFVSAIHLHYRGQVKLAMFVCSLLILVRPEGFFIGVMWAFWVIGDLRLGIRWPTRVLSLGLLAIGSVAWWLVAWLITGDPLFIRNNWPPNWPMTGTIYGSGAWWSYLIRMPEIIGPFFIPAFTVGIWSLLKQRELRQLVFVFLLFLALHTILRRFGLLGSAGYPRYFVAISPAIALISLTGWNRFAERVRYLPLALRQVARVAILLLSGLGCFAYLDGAEWIRDARAAREMHQWFARSTVPVTRLIWSEAYMCILLDRDPWENPGFSGDRVRDLAILRASPAGTLIFWDSRYGPKWMKLGADDFVEAGYEKLYEREFVLKGYVLPRSFFGFGGPRHQFMYFFYKRGG